MNAALTRAGRMPAGITPTTALEESTGKPVRERSHSTMSVFSRGKSGAGLKRSHVFRERPSVVARNSLNNLLEIKKILLILRRERSAEQQKKLLTYLKQVKVFKDVLQDDNDAYEALSSTIQLIDVDRGTTLFREGEDGDLFYIII